MRNPDTWKVAAEVDAREAETAEYLLGELGAIGSQEEDTSTAEIKRITAYFERGDNDRLSLRDSTMEAFSRFPGLAGAWIEVELEPAKDWNEGWRDFFKPFVLAPGFVVVPSWERYEPGPGETIIHLDPGMAFGTGLHETTRLCANALVDLASPCTDSARSLMDVGTGSGILAVLAAKLGVGRIAGVENEPRALEVARDNLEENSCPDIALYSDIDRVPGEYDIVVANILLMTLLELREQIAGRVAPGGRLILSGITRDQEGDILTAYSGELVHASTEHAGEWSAIVLWRPTNAPVLHR